MQSNLTSLQSRIVGSLQESKVWSLMNRGQVRWCTPNLHSGILLQQHTPQTVVGGVPDDRRPAPVRFPQIAGPPGLSTCLLHLLKVFVEQLVLVQILASFLDHCHH